jgi:hypothetical protein
VIDQPHWAVGVAFIVVGALFTLVAGRNLLLHPESIKPFRGPVIAMELARTRGEVASLLEEAGRRNPQEGKDVLQAGREFIEAGTRLDQRFVIPLYVVVFSVAAVLAFWCAPQKLGLASHVAGVVLCVAMVGVAAGFDVRENEGTLDVMARTRGMTRAQIESIDLEPTLRVVSHSATVKFALLFLVTLVLAAPVAMRGGWGYALSLFFVASALVGLVSLAPRFHSLLEIGFTLTCLCLLLAGVWFLRLPQVK